VRRIQDLSVRWKLSLSIDSMLVLMLVVNTASFRTAAIDADSQLALDQSLHVQRLADDALSALTNMETGYRGYLLTGRQASLDPYIAGQLTYRAALAELVRVSSRPDQLDRWQTIADLAEGWQQVITEPIWTWCTVSSSSTRCGASSPSPIRLKVTSWPRSAPVRPPPMPVSRVRSSSVPWPRCSSAALSQSS
jgi:hypothetical protein